jgi:copper(I)-binding protein
MEIPVRTTRIPTLAAGLAAVPLLLGALAACGSEGSDAAASDPSSSATEEASGEISLSVTDPWVKAADSGMTAAFGTLVNDGDVDVTVVSASSDVSAMVELHETVDDGGSMTMQQKEGGFTVPAGGSHELAPGGDHLMVMDLSRALEPGEDVTLTLTVDDGTTVEVRATVKEFTGAEEEYVEGGSHGSGGMESDGMESDGVGSEEGSGEGSS